jgi:hypothetical protein
MSLVAQQTATDHNTKSTKVTNSPSAQAPSFQGAADDPVATVSEQVARIRERLAAAQGEEVTISPDGVTLAQPTAEQGSSVDADTRVTAVPHQVVAASAVSDQIAEMRRKLASHDGSPLFVDNDGTIVNPGAGAPTASSSVNSNRRVAVTPKQVVAADSAVADQIAQMRQMLANRGSDVVFLNNDGTIVNPGAGAPTASSSVNSNQRIAPSPKQVVAAPQWYESNPALQEAEIAAMRAFEPDAQFGYLPDGKMFWPIRIRPEIAGERKDWTFLAVYDADHPQKRWGGSVKFYPVSPSYDEMRRMVEASSVTPKFIPHMLRDEDDQMYLCTQHYQLVKAGHSAGEEVTSAAACLRMAMVWVNYFEYGLHDQEIWSEFQRHRGANE